MFHYRQFQTRIWINDSKTFTCRKHSNFSGTQVSNCQKWRRKTNHKGHAIFFLEQAEGRITTKMFPEQFAGWIDFNRTPNLTGGWIRHVFNISKFKRWLKFRTQLALKINYLTCLHADLLKVLIKELSRTNAGRSNNKTLELCQDLRSDPQ